jgi:hypothetical protein
MPSIFLPTSIIGIFPGSLRKFNHLTIGGNVTTARKRGIAWVGDFFRGHAMSMRQKFGASRCLACHFLLFTSRP